MTKQSGICSQHRIPTRWFPERIAVLFLTEGGRRLADFILAAIPGAQQVANDGPVAKRLARLWRQYDGFVCIMAAGIVVRAVAPLVGDKGSDPCVVVMDEKGEFAVSLLAGHLGGGNDLARRVAAATGGRPVITTASDVLGHTALDLWMRDNDLVAGDGVRVTAASARLVNSGRLRVRCEVGLDLPGDFEAVAEQAEADVVVTLRPQPADGPLFLHPRRLVVGVGCNRDTAAAELESAFAELLAERVLTPLAVRNLASITLKRDEPGLLAFAAAHGWRIDFFDQKQLNRIPLTAPSATVHRATGAFGVAEPAALLSAGTDQLLVEKRKWKNVTMAIALAG
ncbi:MAG: cobalamin biosynthesis protein [Thermodesulfobacteriota bacterium]